MVLSVNGPPPAGPCEQVSLEIGQLMTAITAMTAGTALPAPPGAVAALERRLETLQNWYHKNCNDTGHPKPR
jgi:hypothetical protein